MSVPKLILYTRPDCHLCDEAKAALRLVARQVRFELEERNVDDLAEWADEFGDQVPVGILDDRKVFKYRVDPARLRTALRARGG